MFKNPKGVRIGVDCRLTKGHSFKPVIAQVEESLDTHGYCVLTDEWVQRLLKESGNDPGASESTRKIIERIKAEGRLVGARPALVIVRACEVGLCKKV